MVLLAFARYLSHSHGALLVLERANSSRRKVPHLALFNDPISLIECSEFTAGYRRPLFAQRQPHSLTDSYAPRQKAHHVQPIPSSL